MAIERIDSREVYRNPWLCLREDSIRRQDGSEGVYSVVEKPDFALVIARDGDVYHMVEQYRYPIGQRCVEFPQGSAPGCSGLEQAQRELREETGFTAERWLRLGRLWAAYGFCRQGYEVWLAEGLTPGERSLEPEEQDMRSLTMTAAELETAFREGTIADAHSVAAWGLLNLFTQR